ncbi:prefoldin subunit 4 isoform X1 [Bubalus bubalis]|uniref:prefoldin subunit 4 isoform X1 n=1 Tax=Bubalus bubalis TaxID=89462 RepID=UPI001E1B7F41|nr:prefoldin subunit 4 isoform X1 [Bubalus bubalis]
MKPGRAAPPRASPRARRGGGPAALRVREAGLPGPRPAPPAARRPRRSRAARGFCRPTGVPAPLIGAYQVLPGCRSPRARARGAAGRRPGRGDVEPALRPPRVRAEGERGRARGRGSARPPSPPRAVAQSQDGGHHEEGGCRRCQCHF